MKKKEHYLEKSLKDLEHIFEQRKEEKPGILKKIISKKPLEEKHKEAKIEIAKKREGKSRKFVKCHKLLLKADDALQKEGKKRGKNLYLKARKIYLKLDYIEKKEIYNELMQLYNKLGK